MCCGVKDHRITVGVRRLRSEFLTYIWGAQALIDHPLRNKPQPWSWVSDYRVKTCNQKPLHRQ